jgi:GxxExxY protein
MKHGLNTDLANPATTGLAFGDITENIIGSAFEVHKTLGYGFLEKVYQKALQAELQQRGLQVVSEQKIKVYYKGIIVGDYEADLLVENSVLVEIKVTPFYNKENEAQLLNELKATQVGVGLLLNFGRTKVEFKRFVF